MSEVGFHRKWSTRWPPYGRDCLCIVPKVYEEWEFYSNCSIDQVAPRLGRYQCTVARCSKFFDRKFNWRSHERGIHRLKKYWRCQETAGTTGWNRECFKVFFDYMLYEKHLEIVHSVDDQAMSSKICDLHDWTDNRYPGQFWCGFCCGIVDLKTRDPGAWDERSEHIASQHFAFDQTMET